MSSTKLDSACCCDIMYCRSIQGRGATNPPSMLAGVVVFKYWSIG